MLRVKQVNSLKSGFLSYSDCPVVKCLKLHLKMPDPLKKKSAQSDHSVQRKLRNMVIFKLFCYYLKRICISPYIGPFVTNEFEIITNFVPFKLGLS